MPVMGLRGEDARVDHIVVRKTVQGDGTGNNRLDAAFESPRTVRRSDDFLDGSIQPQQRDRNYEDDDGFGLGDRPTPPFLVTMTVTLPQAEATGGAVGQNSPTETVVVSIPPPPAKHQNHKGSISQTTEHLLIAAGSIGVTMVVVMILLAIHTMRKRGLTFAEAVKQGKYQVTRRGPPPPPKQDGSIRHKPVYSTDYGSVRNDTLTAPEPAMARNGSFSSQRPLLIPQHNGSLNHGTSPVQPAGSDTEPPRFLLDSSPRRNPHRRDASETPSSPVLPLQTQRKSDSTRNTRSMSGGSELQYPEPPIERSWSPLPPPPTFKQFLFNRRSISQRACLAPMVSRFSWTNSQAPQTPHDHNRDTNSHTVMRDSYMTSRSSVPRFRTVDSWVNQQANRIEEQKLQEQFRLTQTSTIYFSGDDAVPDVPILPKNVGDLKEGTTPPIIEPSTSKPVSPPAQPVNGLPGKNIKHERQDTHTTVDTAPIFRQHPGNEVRFSTASLVPSEILDDKMPLNVLS